ncbi:MAG: metal-dependent hydrolase, partial [Anaerolineaceae bacterium]
SHSLIGLTASQVFRPNLDKSERYIFVGLSILLPILPDLDGLSLIFKWLPYGHEYGHRGFGHSLFAAALIGAIATVFMIRITRDLSQIWPILLLYFTAITSTHGILDMATSGGKGIAVFAPFSDERYFLPFRPIYSAPMRPSNFISRYGLNSIMSEALTIWAPCFAILIFTRRLSSLVHYISTIIARTADALEGHYHILLASILMFIAVMAWIIQSAR